MEFLRAHRERGNALSPKDRESLGSIEDIWTPAAQMATVGIFILLLGAFLYFGRPVLLPVVAAVLIGTTLAPIVKAGARHRISPWATAIALGLVLVAAVAAAACADVDNRPKTLEYITEAILQPSCGQYVCHSSYRMERGYAFDTVAMARRSLALIVVPGDLEASRLNTVLTRTVRRMPYDSPLPDQDIELIQAWIIGGAKGLGTP